MKRKNNVDYARLFEFCFDWGMGNIAPQEKVVRFSELMMPFSEFKAETYKCGWWIDSMAELSAHSIFVN